MLDSPTNERSRFRRVLVKVSGELFAGKDNDTASHQSVADFANVLLKCRNIGVEIAVVVGGGNFWRGANNTSEHLDRGVADRVGMLATVMNGLLLSDALSRTGLHNRLYCAFDVSGFAPAFDARRAKAALEDGEVVLLTGGVGMPMFTTDTGAIMRAAELRCDTVLKGTQVDGVYDSDPRFNKEAKRFEQVTCTEVLSRKLGIIDATAATLARENHLTIEVFLYSSTY